MYPPRRDEESLDHGAETYLQVAVVLGEGGREEGFVGGATGAARGHCCAEFGDEGGRRRGGVDVFYEGDA